MPRSCYHCPRAGTGKLGFSFVRITALLVSCRPDSCFYAQCRAHVIIVHVQGQASLVSLLSASKRCWSHVGRTVRNARIMLLYAQCRAHVIIVHVQGQASLVSLLSASRRCWYPALASGWGQATVSSSGRFHLWIEYRRNNSHFSSWSQSFLIVFLFPVENSQHIAGFGLKFLCNRCFVL